MKTVTFGSLEAANDMRSKVNEYLADSDSRRSKTLTLSTTTPDRILDRVKDTAFTTGRDSRKSAEMGELTDNEQQSLNRQHRTFQWQKHGFEAMRVKGALERKGVTDWMDYYEPGEGVQSALSKLQSAKQRAAEGGGRTAVGGDFTDEEELSGKRRMRKQSERMQAGEREGAKRPAFGGDTEAIDFLQQETRFEDDLYDISFGTGEHGQPTASGTDVEKLRDANQERSAQAIRMDDLRQAPITRDPLKWAQNKATLDFPGVDTLDPEKKHQKRSERAQKIDEDELATIADDIEQWASDMDRYDLQGVDTPE